MKMERPKDANEILREINQEILKKFNGQEYLPLELSLATGSFSVTPISQEEYEKLLDEKEQMSNRIKDEFKTW